MKRPELRLDENGDVRRLVEGQCGHCKAFVSFKDPEEGSSLKFTHVLDHDDGRTAEFRHHYFVMGVCTRPRCNQPTILYVVETEWSSDWRRSVSHQEMVYPKVSLRPQLASEVPEPFRLAYSEAAAIEFASPTAAAFLAGRVLEQALRTKLQKKAPLVKLIDELLEKGHLTSGMHEMMHDLREFRNIASHPAHTDEGAVIAVDQVEASYTLDILAELLDFLYVRPARQSGMRERYKAKKAGKVIADSSALPLVEPVKREPKSKEVSPFDVNDDDLPF